jgi:hypothetical protein
MNAVYAPPMGLRLHTDLHQISVHNSGFVVTNNSRHLDANRGSTNDT